jgi:hypothetical protein
MLPLWSLMSPLSQGCAPTRIGGGQAERKWGLSPSSPAAPSHGRFPLMVFTVGLALARRVTQVRLPLLVQREAVPLDQDDEQGRPLAGQSQGHGLANPTAAPVISTPLPCNVMCPSCPH